MDYDQIIKLLHENDPNLTEVDLAGRSLRGDRVREIALALHDNAVLKGLVLRKNGFGSSTVYILGKMLRRNRRVEEIDLSENPIKAKGAKGFLRFLQSNVTMRKLIMRECQINADAAQAIGSLVRLHSAIEHIDVSHNDLGNTVLEQISWNISSSTTLKTLILDDNHIFYDRTTLDSFAYALKSPKMTLEHISLADNFLGPEGAKVLASGILENTSLRYLQLKGNKIKDRGVKEIITAVHASKLKTLILDSNGIGNEGASYVSHALFHGMRLESLSLSYNEVGASGCQSLAEGVRMNTYLKELFLAHNEVGDEGCIAMARALSEQGQETLELIDLSVNKIHDSGWMAWCETFRNKSTSLSTAIFTGNPIGSFPPPKEVMQPGLRSHVVCGIHDEIPENIESNCLKAVEPFLQSAIHLQKLDLKGCFIGPTDVRLLADALSSNSHIKSLDLSRNWVGTDAFTTLCEKIATGVNVESLILRFCEIDDFSPFFRAMSSSSQSVMEHVDLSENPCMKEINFGDVPNTHLKELILRCCQLKRFPIDLFEKNPNLELLDVSDNKFEDEIRGNHWTLIGPKLSGMTKLRSLIVRDCGMENEGIDDLSSSLFDRCYSSQTKYRQMIAGGDEKEIEDRLRLLDIGENKITLLPERLQSLQTASLIEVKYDENPILRSQKRIFQSLRKKKLCGIYWFGLLMMLGRIAFYILDLVTDVLIIKQFLEREHIIWFVLSLLIFLGGYVLQLIAAFAGLMDTNGDWIKTPSTFVTIFFGLFNLHYVAEGAILLIKYKGQFDEMDVAVLKQGGNVSLPVMNRLKVIESFVESFPQALVQTYAMLASGSFAPLNISSIIISLISVGLNFSDVVSTFLSHVLTFEFIPSRLIFRPSLFIPLHGIVFDIALVWIIGLFGAAFGPLVFLFVFAQFIAPFVFYYSLDQCYHRTNLINVRDNVWEQEGWSSLSMLYHFVTKFSMALTKIHQLLGIIPYHDSISFMFLSMYHTLFLVVGSIMALTAMSDDDGFDDQMPLTIGLTIPILLAYLVWMVVLGCGVFIVQWRHIQARFGRMKRHASTQTQTQTIQTQTLDHDVTSVEPSADQV
eukprot:TRINITY_DN9028_c0_g1_i1.p1 TRINITY_DN9028_c0_g1~~TRINITY_DN9028_c0_g1_i1.p1  ORF type:complete len:1123 (+),score=261.89 TRINITY_DN9028_c0_g1_i1:112-3369(+)